MVKKIKKQKTKIKAKVKIKTKIKTKAKIKTKVLPKTKFKVSINKKVSKKIVKKSSFKKKSIKIIAKKNKVSIKTKPKTKLKVLIKKKTIKNAIKKETSVKLERYSNNPVLRPSYYPWESEAVLNPAAVISGGRVHLFYRALGPDGVSRIGYASSPDGINFDIRLTYPVYVAQSFEEAQKHWPFTSPARLVYDPYAYASGGGWGGCEDPRAVIIDGIFYMTFNMFNGWSSLRVAVTTIKEEDLLNKRWNWQNFAYLSKPGDRQKNWVLFPEKINGKFALFHNLDKGDPSRVHIAYLKRLNMLETPTGHEAPDPQHLPDHEVAWHYRTRSAAAPPVKTKDGWLLLYHAMDKNDKDRYKVGVLLLDLKDPTKVLYRSKEPILEPDEWYENDYKPGIVYVSGAVVKDGKLLVYYGGGDKYIAIASIGLDELVENLKKNKKVTLKNNKLLKLK